MCLQILQRYGIYYPHLHAYLEEVDKYKFQYFIFHETTTPYSLKAEGMFRKIWIVPANPLEWIVPSKPHFFTYLLIHFLVCLYVSNAYKFRLVFHVSQDFSWHMNCVCHSPFVNCVFKSFLLYIYHNLQAYLLFGWNR